MFVKTFQKDKSSGLIVAVILFLTLTLYGLEGIYAYAREVEPNLTPTAKSSQIRPIPVSTTIPIIKTNKASSNSDLKEKDLLLSCNIDDKLSYNATTPSLSKIPNIDSWNKKIRQKYSHSQVLTLNNGVKYIKMRYNAGRASVTVNVVEVNKRLNNSIEVTPALSSNEFLHSKNDVRNIARKNNSLAAINGSFFKPASGVPLGTLMINNEFITGPIYNRVSLGIEEYGYKMERIKIDAKLKSSNKTIKVDNLNQPRMLATYVIAYTAKWGKYSEATPKYGLQVLIADGKVKQKSTYKMEIPRNGYVIIGPAKILNELKINEEVSFEITSNPGWENVKHIISGGPFLVKNGKVFVDAAEQKFNDITGRNPRTAIGFTKDDELLLITVDGRTKNNSGMTFYELANLMKKLGCVYAMNLDGGGSTQMFVKNRIVNTPSDNGERQVSNALILKLKK